MRSSTSSSRTDGPWVHRLALPHVPPSLLLSALAAFLIAALLLGGLECTLRRHGYRAGVTDDKNLWSHVRDEVGPLGPRDVVLLGSSRMQLDFSLDTFRSRYPDRKVVQLAIDGSLPFASLHDIAANTRFAGTVLCDVHAFGTTAVGSADPQARYVAYYHHDWGFNRRWNRGILSAVQERVTLMNPAVGVNGLTKAILTRRYRPPYAVTRPDRETFLDKAQVTEATRQQIEAGWVSQVEGLREKINADGRDAWERSVAAIRADVQAIQAHGGKVAIIRFPTSGSVRAADERCFPRAEYWEPFTRGVGGTALNYADVPALTALQCAEGSHLDYRDAPAFTTTLCEELERRSVLALAPGAPGARSGTRLAVK